ncbi:MAG: O-antigen ligase family protein [Candidatus Omnitrophica bacterium]|nr:O-antigen ligase family protein [Candidatus Omnitrophota bacterium]
MSFKEKIISSSVRLLYWLIIILPFVGSFSSAAVNIVVGCLVFTYIFKKILSKDYRLVKTVISIPFLFLILISVLSIKNSTDLSVSIHGLLKLLKYGLLFLIICESVVDVKHIRKIITSSALGLLFASLDAIYQLHFGKDFFRGFPLEFTIVLPRVRAAFPHPNVFAIYLILLLPLTISVGLYFFKNRKRLFFTIVSILSFFSLVFTFSRGGMIGFIVAVIFIAILQKDKALLILFVLALFIAPLMLPAGIKDWAKNRSSTWEVLLNAERIYIYKSSLNMIKDHPFIGVGVNTFCLNYGKYKSVQSYGRTQEDKYYAHNNFLHMAGEIGLSGLGIFFWLLFALFKKATTIYNSLMKGHFLKICLLGLSAGIIAFLINGLTESSLYYSKVATLFWFQTGLLMGIFKVSEKSLKEGERYEKDR